MPKFRVQLADGRIFDIEGDRPPTESEVMALVGPKPNEPTAPQAPTAGGLPPQLENAQDRTVLETVGGLLNTVPRMLEQGVTSGLQVAKGKESLLQAGKDVIGELNPYSPTTGETPLAELGMEPGLLRAGLGLGLDLAAPVGPVGALVGKAGKLAVAGSKQLNKIPEVASLTSKIAAEATNPETLLGMATKAGKGLQSKFVQYPGLNKIVGRSGTTAEDYMRLQAASQDAIQAEAKTKIGKIWASVDNKDIETIVNHLNDPAGYPLPANRTDLAKVVDETKSLLDDQFQQELAAGQHQKWKHKPDGSVLTKKPQKVPVGPAGHLQRPEGPAAPIKTQIENYFPWVFKRNQDGKLVYEVKAINSKNPFVKERNIKTWEQAKEAGAVTDPIKALEKRIVTGQRSIGNQDFFAAMAKEFGTSTQGPIPKGYREINLNKINLADESKNAIFKGVAFPEEVAKQMEKNHLIFTDPDGVRKLAQTINRGFKAIVTTWNPAHHANNLQGNVNLMLLGGMKVKDVAKAYGPRTVDELHTMMGSITPKKGVDPQQVAQSIKEFRSQPLTDKLSIGEAFDSAKKYNLFGSAETNIDLQRAIGRKKSYLSKKTDDYRYRSSRYIEDPAKWALFKDQLLKGKTPEQAAIHVKNFLFDYNELTDFEKGLRDYGAAPFYTWMRKNLPLQMRSAVQTPQTFRRLQVAYDAPDRVFGDNILAQPLWQREEGYEPFNKNPDGSTTVVRMANPALDLNKLKSPGAFLKNLAGPLPTAAIEAATWRDLRTGQQILGTESGYTAASPLGSTMEQLRHLGVPLGTSFGTEATADGKMIQKEVAAFALNQIPTPLLPYAQRIAGSPGETIGTQLKTTAGKKVVDILLRAIGLTPRNLTAEQQLMIVQDLLSNLVDKPIDQTVIKETGKALRNQ